MAEGRFEGVEYLELDHRDVNTFQEANQVCLGAL